MAGSITGNLLINNKFAWGFPVRIISNIIWILFELLIHGWKITSENRAKIIMYIIFTGINIHSLTNWEI